MQSSIPKMDHDIRAELSKTIPEDILPLVTRSYDIYGSKQKAVAIIEINKKIEKIEIEIAKAIMKVNKNVSSVLLKTSGRKGNFRIRNLRLLIGDPDTEVLHRESGCVLRLDPSRVYFSPRESVERDRLVAEVNENEDILVMFSGVGPLPIRIAKKHSNVEVTAVELNPIAHNYCIENIFLNKVSDRVKTYQGDIREIYQKLGKRFDRIMMPLPKGAYKFLDIAMSVLKDVGVLHFYHWASQEDPFSEAERLILNTAKKSGRNTTFLNRVMVSQYSPRTWKIRIDARLFIKSHHSE